MEPLISVIVPVYNVEPYLRKCVDSILNQTYRNLEVILVDDGSPDGCPAICDEYAEKDDRIRVIHKINEGQAIARNTALRVASGEYVAFVDSDDWIERNLYETVMQHAPFDVALFGCTYVNAKTGEQVVNAACDTPTRLCWREDTAAVERIVKNSLFGYACNKVYSKSVLHGLEIPNVQLREDLLFNMEVYSRTSEIRLVDCSGYYYVQHENSTLKKCYSGDVPDISYVAKKMTVIHPQLPEAVNRSLANSVVKQYLCDAMYKFIFMNQTLTGAEAISAIRIVFSHRAMIYSVPVNKEDNSMFKLLAVCYKYMMPGVFYCLMRTKWNRG